MTSNRPPLHHAQKPVQVDVARGVEVAPGEPWEVGRVSMHPERRVAQVHAAAVGREERIDVLPDDLTAPCDLEQPPMRSLADQRVSVGKSVRAADVGAVERRGRAALVGPLDLFSLRVQLDYAGVASAGRVGAVVEDQDVAAFELRSVVLVADLPSAPSPRDVSGLA